MRLPFVSRAAYDAQGEELAATCIVNGCLTDDLTAARERLAEYEGRRTVPEVLEEHDVHRKALADALGDQMRHLNWDQLIADVVRLNTAARGWMADYAAEKKRADHLESESETGRLKRQVAHLQHRLNDAVGLGSGSRSRPEDSSRWQPGYPAAEAGEGERVVTTLLRYFRQVVAPNGRHRPRRRTVSLDELLGQPTKSPAGVFVQAWDDCPHCGKATAGVLHKDGWTCGECLTVAPAGGAAA